MVVVVVAGAGKEKETIGIRSEDPGDLSVLDALSTQGGFPIRHNYSIQVVLALLRTPYPDGRLGHYCARD